MLSTRAGVALPVRRPRNSSRKTFTAFSMRSSASKRISSLVIVRGPSSGELADYGTEGVAGNGPLDVPLALEVEDENGELRLPAQADGRSVHHAQIIAEDLVVSQLLVANGVWVQLGV